MAATLKELFTPELLGDIAAELGRAHPAFDHAGFVARCLDGLEALELTGRATWIAEALHDFLPQPFARAAAVIEAAFGPEIAATGENGLTPLRYMPHAAYIRKYGLEDYDAAIRLQAELTKRFTAEFSIRAFLDHYPERTYAQMLSWAGDENAHLRRLASEGLRPRLPWAPRLRGFQADPRPVLAVLERLKDDPERYVQRSVANNLNDIAKDHPTLVLETCRRWAMDAPAGRAWIVGHALRTLIKAGNAEAIGILGGTERPQVRLDRISVTPASVPIGGRVQVSFEVESTGAATQRLLIDYAVHFVKANGAARPKVFKLRAVDLPPGGKVVLRSSLSLAEMTTRRHYAGWHRVDALVNGEAHPLGGFEAVD
jgi:3-methyladenine DNA glycosylase AlkC